MPRPSVDDYDAACELSNPDIDTLKMGALSSVHHSSLGSFPALYYDRWRTTAFLDQLHRHIDSLVSGHSALSSSGASDGQGESDQRGEENKPIEGKNDLIIFGI